MDCPNSEVPYQSNTELMRKTAGGDFDAFARLFLEFGPVLERYFAGRGAGPALCDDLVQRVFAGLWRQRKEFHAGSSFETYLFAVARNTLSNEIRRSRTAAEALRNHRRRHDRSCNGFSHPETQYYLEELRDAIEDAKGKLTEEQRRVLDAVEGTDAPPDKIPEEPGCSQEALKGRLKRARKRLRELLAPFLEDQQPPDGG